MDWQAAFNVVMGVGLVMLGWMLRSLSEAMRDLRNEDKNLADRVAGLSTVVATDYVRKDDFRAFADAIFSKLDRIEDKLDGKADRAPR